MQTHHIDHQNHQSSEDNRYTSKPNTLRAVGEAKHPRHIQDPKNSTHTSPDADITPTPPHDNQPELQEDDDNHSTLSPEADPRAASADSVAQQNHQRFPQSYKDHPILGLEKIVVDLSNEDAKIARALFVLVGANHSRVDQHVEDLIKLFSPTRERLEGVMAMHDKTKATLDEAESDPLKYEAFVEHLVERKAGDARAFLHLGKGVFKDRLDFAGPLNETFSPWKQRKMNELATTRELLGVFEKIDDAVYQQWR